MGPTISNYTEPMRRQIQDVWTYLATGLFSLVIVAACQPAYSLGLGYSCSDLPGFSHRTVDPKLVLPQHTSVVSKRLLAERRFFPWTDAGFSPGTSCLPPAYGAVAFDAMAQSSVRVARKGCTRVRDSPVAGVL